MGGEWDVEVGGAWASTCRSISVPGSRALSRAASPAGPGWVDWRLEVCSPWRPSLDGMWWQHRDGPSSRRAGPDPGFDFHPEAQEVRAFGAQPLAGVTRVSRGRTAMPGAGRGPDHEPTAVSPSELRAGHGKWGDWPITGWPADGALGAGAWPLASASRFSLLCSQSSFLLGQRSPRRSSPLCAV